MSKAQKVWLAWFVANGTALTILMWLVLSVIDVWNGCQWGEYNAYVALAQLLG